MDIFITGLGAISTIGNNVDEIYASLLAEKTGIRKGTLDHSMKYHVGEVPLSNEGLMEHFKLKTKGSRTALLGMVAAKEAFQGHQLMDEVRTGLISGTSVGGMDITEEEYRNY